MIYPKDWKHSTIDELCDQQNSLITDGDWVESKDQDPNGSNRLIQLADIGDGVFIDKSARFMNDEQFNRLNCTEMIEGDILIARMPEPLGRACLFPHIQRKCATVVDVAILRVSTVSHYWLMSLLNSAESRRYIESNSSGSTRIRITRKALGKMPIPLPSLLEQNKIAEVLSTVDDKIDSIEQEIDQTRTLKKGLMQKLLTGQLSVTGPPHTFKDSKLGLIPETWEVVKIKDVCSDIIDCVNKTAPVVEHKTNYKMIRTTNVRHGRVNTVTVRYVENDIFEQWTRRGTPQDGDIIFTREAPVGEAGILKNSKGVFLGQRLIMYRSNEQTNNCFLLYSILGHICQKQIEDLSHGGTVAHMRVPDCGEFKLFYPPLPEQKKIAEILGGVDEKLDVLAEKKVNYTTLKKGLMQKLLTGKIRVEV